MVLLALEVAPVRTSCPIVEARTLMRNSPNTLPINDLFLPTVGLETVTRIVARLVRRDLDRW